MKNPTTPPKPGPKIVTDKKIVSDKKIPLEAHFKKIGVSLKTIGQIMHGSTAIKVVSIIDYDLQRCIQCKFNKLNSEMRNRIFRGNGPLSHLSARIDVAYALDITTDTIHQELHKIREIRNAFAHTKSFLNFDEDPIKRMF